MVSVFRLNTFVLGKWDEEKQKLVGNILREFPSLIIQRHPDRVGNYHTSNLMEYICLYVLLPVELV